MSALHHAQCAQHQYYTVLLACVAVLTDDASVQTLIAKYLATFDAPSRLNMELLRILLPLLSFFLASQLRLASSGDGIVRQQLEQFTEFKCRNTTVCATSQPNKTLRTRSKLQCTLECQRLTQEPATCVGVNYHQQNSECDIFYNSPTLYANYITGCQYIQVRHTDCKIP